MKITVVTINYNNLEGLRETVESVMGQSFPDLEYIVIDGGSTDGSREYLKACHQKTFSYWCSEPDNGLYDAMNKGLKHSTGDYVIFMNSGDRFFSKETLNNVSERIVGNEDVVYGSALFRYSDGYVLRPPQPLERIRQELPFCHQSVFVKGDIIRHNPFDLRFRLLGDYNMFFNLWNDGKCFKEIDTVVSIYDASGLSANSANRRTMYAERCNIHGTEPSCIRYFILRQTENIKELIRLLLPQQVRNRLRGRGKEELSKQSLQYFISRYN